MLLSPLLISTISFALAQTIPPIKITAFPKGKMIAASVHAPADHHFNLDAPNAVAFKAEKIKPATATKERISFELTSEKNAAYLFEVYVCDNANTFCTVQKMEKLWTGLSFENASPKKTKVKTEKPLSAKKDELGFYLNNSDQAFEEAEKSGKSVFIDFFAIWCPPCNQLDEEVYPSTAFKTAAKNYVLLKMDVDSPVSWELKSKYKVGGYPTVILTKPNGDELTRLVGFFPTSIFVETMKNKRKVMPDSPEDLKRFDTEMELAQKGDKSSLQKAIQTGNLLLEKVDKKTGQLAGSDLTTGDLLEQLSGLYEEAGEKVKANETYVKLAAYFKAKMQANTIARSHALGLAWALWKSGNYDKADEIYVKYTKKYPKEFTFHYARSRMFVGKKDFAKAKESGEKAYRYAYGDNRLRAAESLAKTYVELKDKESAKKVLNETLAQTQRPTDDSIRTAKYIDSLTKLRASLN